MNIIKLSGHFGITESTTYETYINMSNVCEFFADSDKTILVMNGGYRCFVKETPDEIIEIMTTRGKVLKS